MRIEILYVPGCPNYQATLERIQEVLASESVRGEIHGVPVKTEARCRRLEHIACGGLPRLRRY